MQFSVYDATGRVVGRFGQSVFTTFITDNVPAGGGYISEDIDEREYYISAGVKTLRPTTSVSIDKTAIQANGLDAATITGVPTGWTYTISTGATGTTDGTAISVTAIEPGSYTIRFTNWPYRDIEYTINATATV